ncbi:M3 family oligoendopeptidase [Marinibaculum pumilum]|uniref:M3 family oligoendopeptidase n=1 Tax=Marinibaculum pumilum TaxID=1766165 RepID=A0ABV7L7B4_9PROT
MSGIRAVRQTAGAAGQDGQQEGQAALGRMPEWDLGDLYPAPDSAELERDFALCESEAKALAADCAGRIGSLDGAALAQAIRRYEVLDERLSRLVSYASLVYARDVSDPKSGQFMQQAQERANEIVSGLLFFTLELNLIPDGELAEKLKDPGLAAYEPWLRDQRVFRPYQLDQSLETLLHERSLTARQAWSRLFDETTAAMRFPVPASDEDGAAVEELSLEVALHRLSDRDPAVRRRTGRALGRTFQKDIRLFALITNTLAKDKEIEDRWRKLPAPETARHLANLVEPEVVQALQDAVTAAHPRLSHRYYALKAKWFGTDQLDWWDRNAPLPEAEDRTIPWAEARDIVLDAYRRFSPQLAEIGQRFFDHPWIDAPARPGKAAGAFAHPVVPSVHPYLLVNYQGKTRDVMTLAHELGHGVHQVLAGGQGHFLSQTPLTLAETASVFGEQLTFRAMLEAAGPQKRKMMLAAKVEDMLNTVVRQMAFYDFERRIHGERRQGELSADRISEIWLTVQRESLGPALRFDADYGSFWCYIPHFVHSPFYVYAYAFGDCLVNALYGLYQQAEEGFAERYLDMLRAGGAKRHKELLAPFGLDAADPAFWARGLDVIAGFIDELEELS